MTGSSTKRMIAVYEEREAQPKGFLAGFFQSPERNYHNSEKVTIDVQRNNEKIAVPIPDMSTGPTMNNRDKYTNKELTPPAYQEAIPLNSFDLLKRQIGQNPFENPNFRSNIIKTLFSGMYSLEQKIRRAVELQAAQILQTGKLSLKDASDKVIYQLDFLPKSTHFPIAGVSWETATGIKKLDDIASTARIIRKNGKMNPNQLVFGNKAYSNFTNDEHIRKILDTRNMMVGQITPLKLAGNGGTHRGYIDIENNRYDIYTSDDMYEDPATGNIVPYVNDGSVIIRAEKGRLDATFGGIPNIGKIMGIGSRNLVPEMPARMRLTNSGMDFSTNIWLSDNGSQLFGSVGTRPLLIPTAIDTFACLDTQL